MEEIFATEFAKAKQFVDDNTEKYLTPVWRTRLLYAGTGLLVGGIGGIFMPLVGLAGIGLAIYSMKSEKPEEPTAK